MLKPRVKYALILVSSFLAAGLLIGGMIGGASAQQSTYPYLSTLQEIMERIQDDYVDEPNLNEVFQGAIRGMVERVDPHGGYLDAETVAFYQTFDPLKAPGIGVVLSKKFDYPVIVASTPGGPAANAGLGTGDTIEAIDGETLREHNLVEVHQLLSGPAGSSVELNVIRRTAAGAERITVTRGNVTLPPVETRVIGDDVGYVRIPVFGPGTAAEAAAKIEALQGQGATGLVLDLRNSAGGVRQEGFDLADQFLDSGSMGYLEGQTAERRMFVASAGGVATAIPLAVLVNEGTADAAELAAGALRDRDRGTLVGVRTFGYAAEQKLYPLEDGSALLLSYADYYTPDGDEIQTLGVEPTVEQLPADATNPFGEANGEGDLQLERALEILRAGTETRTAA
jgi:carboxyl-terminal processing protease